MYRKYIKPTYKCDNCQEFKTKLFFIKETLEYVCSTDCKIGSLNFKQSKIIGKLFSLIK